MSKNGFESVAKPKVGSDIALSALTAADLDSVLALARDTVEAPQWSRREYERILLSNTSAAFTSMGFVAQCGNSLAGFAVASFSRLEEISEIETIVVHPRFRRRGIGAHLLNAAKSFAYGTGANRLRLEVRASNRAAIALYSAHGFQPIGRRPSYYSLPVEDALLLELYLTIESLTMETNPET